MAYEADLRGLFGRLASLRDAVREEGEALLDEWRPWLDRRDAAQRCLNLAHYVALRQRDLRPLQQDLPSWGLSSLGRSEGRVLPNIDAILATVGALTGMPASVVPTRPTVEQFGLGDRLLDEETERVLGPKPESRDTRIMVTLPTVAATEPELLRTLIANGMDVARINCAHDRSQEWLAMVTHIREGAAAVGRPCRVHLDLAGPKLRTTGVSLPSDDGRLRVGDRMILGKTGHSRAADIAHCGCSHPEIFAELGVGDEIWFDDGKLGSRVSETGKGMAVLVVTQARRRGERLRAGKGINIPCRNLRIPHLTDDDRDNLVWMLPHVDSVGLSFVRHPSDIAEFQDYLESLGRDFRSTPLIVKIETAQAVEHLPEIIARGTGRQPLGLMIARGDLAVEIGLCRLAEMQEEILWLAEAGHVPVVWATQVLERVVKKGRSSRGEVTDAAMGERAECVMLNKGAYVAEGVAVLHDVLQRMQGHLHKKTPLLRALKSWPIATSAS